jgi:hypothetical protein
MLKETTTLRNRILSILGLSTPWIITVHFPMINPDKVGHTTMTVSSPGLGDAWGGLYAQAQSAFIMAPDSTSAFWHPDPPFEQRDATCLRCPEGVFISAAVGDCKSANPYPTSSLTIGLTLLAAVTLGYCTADHARNLGYDIDYFSEVIIYHLS